ncbi:unnamed protein product, partial [Musa textilis]
MAGIREAKATGGSPRRKLFGFHMSHKEEPAGGGVGSTSASERAQGGAPGGRSVPGCNPELPTASGARAPSLWWLRRRSMPGSRPNPSPRAASLRRSGLDLRLPRAVRPHRRRHVGRATWTSTSASRRRVV